MSKLCVQVESYLQQRFPITAPNNKGGSDKQLFASTSHAGKGDLGYTQKTIFKKNSEQVSYSVIYYD